VVPTDLSGLAPLLPPAVRPLVAAPFPLDVRAVGSRIPIGGTVQDELRQESVTAYEVAYTGTFAGRTTAGVAFYVNDVDDNLNFAQLPNTWDPYTAATRHRVVIGGRTSRADGAARDRAAAHSVIGEVRFTLP
jgi:hypothetical protein